MPSPRLFGFRPARKQSADTGPKSPKTEAIETLADQVFSTAQESPKSEAWGLSPAESYLKRRHRPRD